jgi:hypothetical protein
LQNPVKEQAGHQEQKRRIHDPDHERAPEGRLLDQLFGEQGQSGVRDVNNESQYVTSQHGSAEWLFQKSAIS